MRQRLYKLTSVISPFSTTEKKQQQEQQKEEQKNDSLGTLSSDEHVKLEQYPLKTSPSYNNMNNVLEPSESSSANLMENFVQDDLEYPEGGFRAFSIVFGSFLGLVPVFGTLNSMSVLETFIETHQLSSTSDSTIAWIFSVFSFFMFSTSIISGFYFDIKGCKKIMILGTILHFTSLMLTSICNKIWHFILCFSLLGGLASGILMSPLVSCSSHYFKRRRGLALALSGTGGSIGGIIYPLMLKQFFNKNDYVWGCRTWAFLDLFLLIVSTCILKERFRQEDSKIFTELKQSVDLKSFMHKNYLYCVIGVLLAEMSITSSLTFFGSYCNKVGIPLSTSYNMITVINAMGIPGRWVPGYLSDKFGRYNMAIITITSLALVTLIGWLPFGNRGQASMYVISAMYGFTSGSIFSLLPVCCGQICNTKDFGKRYSTMYFIVAFGTLVAIPISGAIIGTSRKYENYQYFILFCSLLTILSGVSFWISRYYSIKTFKPNVVF